MDTLSRFEGAMLGLALGDAIGAPHEGGPLERLAWSALGLGRRKVLRWTDDTQMSILAAESLLECGGLDADHLARTWADGCRWERGYGSGARRLLMRIRKGEDWRVANRAIFPDGSYGNGAAMRAAPFGLRFHRDREALVASTRLASEITHAHPLGIEGAVLVANAVAEAVTRTVSPEGWRDLAREPALLERLERLPELLSGDPTPREVVRVLGHGIAASESVVTALYAWLRHRDAPFEELMAFVVSLGGDTDTIGAMAGAAYGADRGVRALPADQLDRLEAMPRIRDLARRLDEAATGR